jgi:hypothetical protein
MRFGLGKERRWAASSCWWPYKIRGTLTNVNMWCGHIEMKFAINCMWLNNFQTTCDVVTSKWICD